MPEWLSRFTRSRKSNSEGEERAYFESSDTVSFNSKFEGGAGEEESMTETGSRKSGRNAQDRKLFVKIEPMHTPTRTEGPNPMFNVVYVNDDTHPILINNEYFTGHAVFRCKDFDGWTPFDEGTKQAKPPIGSSPYFEGHKRTFSFQISGRFRKQWTADDIMFGTFFDKPLSLPRGYSLALGVAKKIDPSMVAVLDVPQPYMCSPLICAMNVAHIQPLYSSPARRAISYYQPTFGRLNRAGSLCQAALKAAQDDNLNVDKPLTLPDWEFGSDRHLEENIMINWPSWTTIPTASNFYRHGNSSLVKASSKAGRTPAATVRRNWFLEEEHRKRFIYHPDTVYSFDFASPYVDLNQMKLKLGINIDVEPYLGDQPIRYECRTRDGSILFWSVELGRR